MWWWSLCPMREQIWSWLQLRFRKASIALDFGFQPSPLCPLWAAADGTLKEFMKLTATVEAGSGPAWGGLLPASGRFAAV